MATIKLPEEAIPQVRQALEQNGITQAVLNNLIQGIAFGLGLKGRYQFDPQNMALIQEDEKKAGKK